MNYNLGSAKIYINGTYVGDTIKNKEVVVNTKPRNKIVKVDWQDDDKEIINHGKEIDIKFSVMNDEYLDNFQGKICTLAIQSKKTYIYPQVLVSFSKVENFKNGSLSCSDFDCKARTDEYGKYVYEGGNGEWLEISIDLVKSRLSLKK